MGFYQLAQFIQVNRVLALAIVALIWIMKALSHMPQTPGKRTRILSIATVLATLGVAIWLSGWFIHIDQLKLVASASFLMGCAGLVLALLGKGTGRVLTAIASFELALSCLPFVLP